MLIKLFPAVLIYGFSQKSKEIFTFQTEISEASDQVHSLIESKSTITLVDVDNKACKLFVFCYFW